MKNSSSPMTSGLVNRSPKAEATGCSPAKASVNDGATRDAVAKSHSLGPREA